MAEETPTPDEETTDDAPVAEEALAEDAAAEAPADEAAAAAEAPAAEAPADEAPAQTKPKRRSKAKATPPRPSMTPQERQAQRSAERRRKATVRSGRRVRERERSRARRDGAGAPEALPSLRAAGTGQQKIRQGIVVSDRAAKTITVRIDVTRRHPRYQKVVRTSATLHAHDEQGEAHTGDTVIVKECRPLSRTKRWRLIEVVERAQ
jgi:small subunit ribosomal protein S17